MRAGQGFRDVIPVVMVVGAIMSSAPASAAPSPPQMHQAIERSCVQQMFMSEAACGCLADQAVAQLDPIEQTWLTLGANNVDLSAPLSKQMSRSEADEVDRFMQTVPDACTRQAGG